MKQCDHICEICTKENYRNSPKFRIIRTIKNNVKWWLPTLILIFSISIIYSLSLIRTEHKIQYNDICYSKVSEDGRQIWLINSDGQPLVAVGSVHSIGQVYDTITSPSDIFKKAEEMHCQYKISRDPNNEKH